MREFYHGQFGQTLFFYALSNALASNVWSKVELICTGTQLNCAVRVNDTQIGTGGLLGPQSQVKIEVGVRAHAKTESAFTANFDNVIVAVDR